MHLSARQLIHQEAHGNVRRAIDTDVRGKVLFVFVFLLLSYVRLVAPRRVNKNRWSATVLVRGYVMTCDLM